MKILFSLVALLFRSYCFGQLIELSFPETSEEEYVYLTKGYKIQSDAGLDMKSGYHFVDLSDSKMNDANYAFELKQLIKESNNTMVGVLIVAKSKTRNDQHYYGIPIGSKELFKRFEKDLGSADKQLVIAICRITAIYTVFFMEMDYDKEHRK